MLCQFSHFFPLPFLLFLPLCKLQCYARILYTVVQTVPHEMNS